MFLQIMGLNMHKATICYVISREKKEKKDVSLRLGDCFDAKSCVLSDCDIS